MSDRIEKNERGTRVVGVVAKALAIVAVALACNIGLSYALIPYGAHSEQVVSDYREVEDRVDTIVLGSSSVVLSVSPDALDEELGSYSYNLAIAQATIGTDLDSIRNVLTEHPGQIRRVVVGITYNDIMQEELLVSRVAMAQAWGVGASPVERLGYLLRVASDSAFIGTPGSVGALAPWSVVNVGFSASEISTNLERRATMDLEEAAAAYSEDDIYQGRGFSTHINKQLDMNNVTDDEVMGDVTEDSLSRVQEIADLCQEYGAELTVFVPLIPSYRVVMYGDSYTSNMTQIRDVVTAAGGTFIDYNLRRDLWDNFSEYDFWDIAHLSLEPALRFSSMLGDDLSRIESGEDISSEFYDYENYDEYLANLNVGTPVFMTVQTTDDGISLHAYSYTGTSEELEFQFLATNEAGDTVEIRAYDADGDFMWVPEEPGEYTIRVNNRHAGSSVEAEHYFEATVSW